ncbi:MAG TPA: DEAD/DEAH box helicase [Mycobacteriales bacterium]|nr:DEAD/DEAH box helicase [Mycobacteriales bacterium]
MFIDRADVTVSSVGRGERLPPRSRRRTRGGVESPLSDDVTDGPGRAHSHPHAEPRHRAQPARQSSAARLQDQGPLAVLAMATANLGRGRVTPAMRAQFQAVALLLREQRAEALTAPMSPAARAATQKRIEGLAASLARVAGRDGSLFELLADGAPMLPGTREAVQALRAKAGLVVEPEVEAEVESSFAPEPAAERERQVVPLSAVQRSLVNPFLAPDFSAAPPPRPKPRLLIDWELIKPLLRSFEQSTADARSCMTLPPPGPTFLPPGLELMPHQAQVVAKAREGHRTFLLADEPGLGKTAQALLAAQAADAYPLLVVVPNVVKTSWAREAAMWTPQHSATVVHGDGETVDAFRDIVVVNYDILGRHVGWLSRFGFRGMIVDEAHFIKNKSAQRSKNVLDLSRKIRERTPRPLLMALTGTPLINDIDDFLAIWEFLGWITENEVGPDLLHALEANGTTPVDPAFYPMARDSVIEMGVVRRRKVEVAKDIPARRVADVPVELEGAAGTSVRTAEKKLVARLLKRYDSAVAARKDGDQLAGIDASVVRQVCARELRNADESDTSGENVFAMMRRIGQAKAELAADYAAQLAHSAGKVVFFAKHIDVMDAAEALFEKRGIGYSSIRGDQSTKVRTANIDAFVNDDDVQVIVCSLTAAGVGINLQVSSNVVLAELSWTAAEQTQAIDRVHRIGQDQPVTAWRIIAAQTVDARVADLIGLKEGLAARALDGQQVEVKDIDVRLETLVSLLTDALSDR